MAIHGPLCGSPRSSPLRRVKALRPKDPLHRSVEYAAPPRISLVLTRIPIQGPDRGREPLLAKDSRFSRACARSAYRSNAFQTAWSASPSRLSAMLAPTGRTICRSAPSGNVGICPGLPASDWPKPGSLWSLKGRIAKGVEATRDRAFLKTRTGNQRWAGREASPVRSSVGR